MAVFETDDVPKSV